MKLSVLMDLMMKEGFSFGAISVAMSARNLNMLKLIEKHHLENMGSYTDEIIHDTKKLMWEESESDVTEGIALWQAIYDFEISHSFNGMGGCTVKTFREIMASKQQAEWALPVTATTTQ